ncbi:MAG: hypothetical protein ACOX0Z_03525 [Candidatus Nanosyncoccaceae bacterium]|jgi:hypothetical protein
MCKERTLPKVTVIKDAEARNLTDGREVADALKRMNPNLEVYLLYPNELGKLLIISETETLNLPDGWHLSWEEDGSDRYQLSNKGSTDNGTYFDIEVSPNTDMPVNIKDIYFPKN